MDFRAAEGGGGGGEASIYLFLEWGGGERGEEMPFFFPSRGKRDSLTLFLEEKRGDRGIK